MRLTRIALLAAAIVWLGGLLRLVGEALSALMSALSPTPSTIVLWVLVAIGILALEGIILWRWAPYRDLIRQSQLDIKSLFGAPAGRAPVASDAVRSVFSATGVIALPALLVAVVLPSAAWAAVAVVVGLAARVAVVSLASASDIQHR